MLPRSVLSILFFALLAGCDGLASWAYQAAIDAEKNSAGLLDKRINTKDQLDWFYLESEANDAEEIVFLIHGFGADSNNWVRFVNELEGEYHFIVPDLPGHGESTKNTTLNYTIEQQAQRVLDLASELDIKQFHIAGSSMGGAIALSMALQAPDRLLSLGLIDAAGVTLLTPEFEALIKDGNNPLIPQTADDMFTTMEWAMADPPWMPDFFITEMGKIKAANFAVTNKILHDIDNRMNLRDRLREIQTPTLILWGDRDRLLGINNAEVFDQEIPNSHVVILPGIGHLPMAESAAESADAFRSFW